MKRRKALQKIVFGTGAAFIIPPVLMSTSSCSKKETADKEETADNGNNNQSQDLKIDLNDTKYADLNSAGGFVIEGNIIIANVGNDTFVALSKACTYDSCTVSYSLSNNNFPCWCCGSVFSTNGSVVNGPASSPLKAYIVTKSDNILTIR